jgi:hypothetical protein
MVEILVKSHGMNKIRPTKIELSSMPTNPKRRSRHGFIAREFLSGQCCASGTCTENERCPD